MSKIEFIHHLVYNNFAKQYEAEQYTVAAGSGEWAYYHKFTKDKANTNQFGVVLYKYEQATDDYWSDQIFCNQNVEAA